MTSNNTKKSPLERRLSTPMASAFMTSAPGKVIVYGEHAVVHGKGAVAAAISLRSYLHVTTLSKSQRTITLNFPDVKLSHKWDIDKLPWSTFQQPSKKKTYYDLVTSLDPELKEAMNPHLVGVSPHLPLESRRIHQSAASAFLYLFLSLGSQSFPGAVYALRSTIPIGAGLGSSASISVCLSSALLLQVRALAGPHPDQPPEEAFMQVERINRWAFVCELCIHENPSGVDNTVSSFGKAVLFKRVDYGKPPKVLPLTNFPELPLLIVDTRQTRSTKDEVQKVANLKQKLPNLTELLLAAIDKVTDSAYALLTNPDYSPQDIATSEILGSLINVNHGLLVSLGVSHPRLDRIREIVDSMGVGYTKLTGAGGGGSAITLLKPGIQSNTMKDLESKLDAENYQRFETTLGTDGVGVLWPAVLEDKEIDLEGFLAAENEDAIKTLVGNLDSDLSRGWKFWKSINDESDEEEA